MTQDAEIAKRAQEWAALSSQQMRLRCGELTAEEIRLIRSVIKAIIFGYEMP